MLRKISSLADRIKNEEAKHDKETVQFAYRLADGLKKTRAFIDTWGYYNTALCHRRMQLTAPLVALLREEANGAVLEKMLMNKEQRIEHLTTTALQAHRAYMSTNEAAHGAVYLKAMSIINTMTGDNAPTEVHHMVTVSHQQLEHMSHSERTEAYKRMMSGKLQLVDNKEESIIEGEILQDNEGGETGSSEGE